MKTCYIEHTKYKWATYSMFFYTSDAATEAFCRTPARGGKKGIVL